MMKAFGEALGSLKASVSREKQVPSGLKYVEFNWNQESCLNIGKSFRYKDEEKRRNRLLVPVTLIGGRKGGQIIPAKGIAASLTDRRNVEGRGSLCKRILLLFEPRKLTAYPKLP